jgi:ABC-2 type transport system permease protein
MATATISLAAQSNNGLRRDLRIFTVETRYEFVRLLRTKAFSLSVIGFPVMFYVLFGLLINRGEHIGAISVARYMLGGYAVFGAVGAALFGVGNSLATELNMGWLELKRASPMPTMAYLLAKCCTAMGFGVIIVSVLCLLGITMGHVTLSLSEYVRMLALTVAAAVPFASTGLLMALLVPANSAPGITNLIYLPMSFLGGLWLPLQMMPSWLQRVAPLLPTYHLGQLMLGILGFPERGTTAGHWFSLLAYTLLVLGAAWIAFGKREQSS